MSYHNYLTMSTYDEQEKCVTLRATRFRFYIPEFEDTHISYARTATYAKVDKIDCDILIYEMRFSQKFSSKVFGNDYCTYVYASVVNALRFTLFLSRKKTVQYFNNQYLNNDS